MGWLAEVVAAKALRGGPGALLGGGPRALWLAQGPADRLLRAPIRAAVTLTHQPGVGRWEVARPALARVTSAALEGRLILGLGAVASPLPCDAVLTDQGPPGHVELVPGLWAADGPALDRLIDLVAQCLRDPFGALGALATEIGPAPLLRRDGSFSLDIDALACVDCDDPLVRLAAICAGGVPGPGHDQAMLLVPVIGTGAQRLDLVLTASGRPAITGLRLLDQTGGVLAVRAEEDAAPPRTRSAPVPRGTGHRAPPAPGGGLVAICAARGDGAWTVDLDLAPGPIGRALALGLAAPGLRVDRITLTLAPPTDLPDPASDPDDPLAVYAPGAW